MDSTSEEDRRFTLRSLLSQTFWALFGRPLYADSNLLGEEGTTARSSNDSDRIQSYKYDVFISFRGPDTRNTFVDHLYAHLTRKGIFAFKDDKKLQKGESISPQLLQAIQHSRVSIVVFSNDYATSTWCLDEMANIVECHTNLKQTVFPVFYDVDPSHVRKQNGVYQNAFVFYTQKFKHNPGKVDQWKRAMTCLAKLAGWDVRNKPESEEIEKIVYAVIKTLGHKFSGFADDLIGIQPRVKALENLLKLSSEDDGFRVLGIWGMGGVGKTTLARVLYDRISCQFDACCFVEDVGNIYKDGVAVGAIAVQKQILHQTIDEKNLETYSPSEISGIVRNRLHNIKLLLVLDDVDQYWQLERLHIKPKLLCTGSRIIITTKDEHILIAYGADTVYKAQLMNDNDARELLCRKAFKSGNSSSAFAELIPEVLKYAQCLPIAIKVMGSFLCNRNVIQWRATLDGLQNNPPDKRIMEVLQISFEGLEERERDIFLHIACFFNGEREDYVRRILDACGLYPNIGIPLISEKSLITIRNQEIHMHKMLQELGKKNVRRENPSRPGLWSRLWLYRDFHHTMMTTEMIAIEAKAIVLDQKEDDFKFSQLKAHDLSKLGLLELLILSHNNFSGRLEFLSNALRYFSWSGYPFTSLPSNFQPHNLVELNMPDSNIEQLWIGIQVLPELKRIDLSNSKNLKRITGFLCIYNLERLDLTGCTNLSEVDPSIGILSKLVFLSLHNCKSLASLDFGGVSKLWSLRVLLLCGCTKLKNTPDFTGAYYIEYLDMERCTSLCTVHVSIGALTKLRFLSLRDCTNLVKIPDSSNNMASLITLDIRGCSNFMNLPRGWIFSSPLLKSLICLDLCFCNISQLPDAIGELQSLERLNLMGNNIVRIPSTIEMLHRLAYLNLSHCLSLEHLPELPTESGPSDSVGRYFETTSESHRSGLYIFDCPKVARSSFKYAYLYENDVVDFKFKQIRWLLRLVKEPRHFRCGFDIVFPWPGQHVPEWFDHQFTGDSIIRVKKSNNMHVDWVGFVFCVAFEVKVPPAVSGSPLPYPFYLSFESENTEERFDMLLDLERNMVDGSEYLWTIYISGEHCHFMKTGAQITFKARHGLELKEWGLKVLTKEDLQGSKSTLSTHLPLLVIDNVEKSSSNFKPKIQLPYNWFVSDEDEVENGEAKRKEINLSNIGF